MTPEGRIKKQIRDWLTAHMIYWTNVAGGAYANPGAPDIIADVNGRFLAIEAKTKTGRQSEQQKVCERMVTDSGGKYIVARSLQDVIDAVMVLKTL